MFALDYHERTKHAFNHFARSPGRLDWATQPDPFRRYHGSTVVPLPRASASRGVPYAALYDGTVSVHPMDEEAVAEFLRCALGLSAWKSFQQTRWPLRVNPSSGNLHPTEGYLVRDGRVFHYAPREHELELRCELGEPAWAAYGCGRDGVLVGLSSIGWREAWKYGERAFRYCQHDVGHAVAALRLSAAMLGWSVRLLARWRDDDVATVLGLDQPMDDPDAEREAPECLMVVTAGDPTLWMEADPSPLVADARAGRWSGRANRLSAGHVQWPVIDEVEAATRSPGRAPGAASAAVPRSVPAASTSDLVSAPISGSPLTADARALILSRRSAVAFDGASVLSRLAFERMLGRLIGDGVPWDVTGRCPLVQLVVFVHRVEGVTPGIYAFLRDPSVLPSWKAATRPEFLWEPSDGAWRDRFFLLLPADVRWPATRVSCDQDIAGDGFFSLGMVAPLGSVLAEEGEWSYRRLFWECGTIGQVLYLEAEAAGGRGTGIGCFYDDAVHDLLGFTDGAWQSLYHFSMGVPVEDVRLTSEPGYPWERAAAPADPG